MDYAVMDKYQTWEASIAYSDGDVVLHNGVLKKIVCDKGEFSINKPSSMVDYNEFIVDNINSPSHYTSHPFITWKRR